MASAISAAISSATWQPGGKPSSPATLDLRLARRQGVRLKLSGATAASLPTLNVGTYCLAGDDILSFEGVLNGTSNRILLWMAEAGISYNGAVAEAVAAGVAEPDPRLDIEGWDTAAKTIILANCLFDTEVRLADVAVTGIQHITLTDLRAAAARREIIKLIGATRNTVTGVEVNVGPQSLPLAALKGIRFVGANLGEIVVAGGSGNPVGTAAAGLKDIINLAREKGLLLC